MSVLDEHREYLSDIARLNLFRRAIRELVHPGAVVADVGSGTGILGLFALQAGAARVYSIEATGMIEIASAVAAANGYASRFHPIHRHSSEAVLPEPADLIVSDFVGRFGFDGDIFDIYPNAAARLLRPGGFLLPSRVSMFLAPVEREDMHAQVRFWHSSCAGFDLSPVSRWAFNTGYPVMFAADDLLAAPAEVGSAVTGEAPPPSLHAEVHVPISRDGMLHGLGGWGAAELSRSVTMTNSPLATERIARRNVFLPIARPFLVRKGETLRIRFGLRFADQIVSWRVDMPSRPGAVTGQTHSTLNGMLLTRDELKRSRPDFVPRLTPRGAGHLTTLTLCDGQRPLREVEDLVYARHPDLFGSRGEAAAFVAEVVAGYARG